MSLPSNLSTFPSPSPAEHQPDDCEPIRQVLARVSDKWTGTVLARLGDGRVRFNDLHRSIAGISQRVLTVTLRNLERDGLLVRTVHPTVPPRVEYALSVHGRSLREALQPVAAWVLAHRHVIDESRERFDLALRQAGPVTRK